MVVKDVIAIISINIAADVNRNMDNAVTTNNEVVVTLAIAVFSIDFNNLHVEDNVEIVKYIKINTMIPMPIVANQFSGSSLCFTIVINLNVVLG